LCASFLALCHSGTRLWVWLHSVWLCCALLFWRCVTLARDCGCGCTACGCVVRFFFGAVSLWHAIVGVVAQRVAVLCASFLALSLWHAIVGVVAQRVALVVGCSMWPRSHHVVAVVVAAECVSCLGKTKCTELGAP
jgi:hypothetical protein